MSKQRVPPILTIHPFSPTRPFLAKIFHPQPYCQIRGTQSLPFQKDVVGGGVPTMNHQAIFSIHQKNQDKNLNDLVNKKINTHTDTNTHTHIHREATETAAKYLQKTKCFLN